MDDMSWFDVDNLSGCVDEAMELLSGNDASTSRLSYREKALTWRVSRMIDIAEWS